MKKIRHLFMLAIMLAATVIFTVAVSANSAEPPSVLIIVSNPPADFSCNLISGGVPLAPKSERTAWEGQYSFHYGQLSADVDYALEVTADGERFVCDFPNKLSSYSGVYTLDIKNRTLSAGHNLTRSIVLVGIRLFLTLIIEGLIFAVFGYRQKRSWAVFFILNVITQGLLNIWFNASGLTSGYIIFALIIGEFFVYLSELAVMLALVKEKTKMKTAIYVLTANSISLVLGWALLTYLPI